jgi:neutral ceramidase
MRRLFVLLLAGAAAAAAQQLQAGLARVEITPKTMLPMYGYPNRTCPVAEGTHDALNAKALVLAAGKDRVAIVTMDIGSFSSAALQRRVADELGIPVLLVAISHTHSGPLFARDSEPDSPVAAAQRQYRAEVEQKLFNLVKQASQSMFPARIGLGKGSLQLGYNRLVLREDGRARAEFQNPNKVPYGPVDPEFVVMRIEDERGAPRAVIVNYACHGVVLQGWNCSYSADWPGAMQSRVEAAMPGSQCMFVQGGAGDINPIMMGQTKNPAEDFKVVDRMGDLISAQVLRTARDIRALAPTNPSIRSKSEVMTFGDRWNKDGKVEAGITTVLIDGEIAIAAVPGEPMHRLQTFWKSQPDVRWPLFFGYTSSAGEAWPGYIPDVRSAAFGGYGADVTTRIEVGGGERIMQRHVINLYELMGMWLDKPGRQ